MKSIRDKSSKCQRAGTSSDVRFPGPVSCQLPPALSMRSEFLFGMLLAGEHTAIDLRRLRRRQVGRVLSCPTNTHEAHDLATQKNSIKHVSLNYKPSKTNIEFS